jgi:signal transduction histidine kinase
MPATRRTRYMLVGTFSAIALLLLASQLVGYLHARQVDNKVDLVTSDALTSIELIGRMAVDLQREHILIDRHIVAQKPAEMAKIEKQVMQARDDYNRAAQDYTPLATFPGEADLWNRLRGEVAAATEQEMRALELSRANNDNGANQILIDAEPLFDVETRDLAQLATINRKAATRTQAEISSLQGEVNTVRGLLALAIVAVTVVLGVMVTRAIARTERILHQKRDELEARNRELDAFAGRVSHDLRGPLNTMELGASMLGEKVPGVASTVEIIRRAVTQMTTLVNELLVLSRAGAPPPGAVARTEQIAQTLESELGSLVQRAGGVLHVDLEPAAVSCSQGLLRDVLWNLGENAVKYHRPDAPPEVALVGRTERGRYCMQVTDNGRGMTAEESSRAFEPFFRSPRTQDLPGTGLGLAIVRRVIEACGGSIALQSQLDRGSTFTLELPLAA